MSETAAATSTHTFTTDSHRDTEAADVNASMREGNDSSAVVKTTAAIKSGDASDGSVGSTAPLSEHLGSGRQYWRDAILGVNDGIISIFLIVAGVSGGGLATVDILLTAIAGGLAGAVSMFAGEFVATKSQNEVMHGEISLEKKHIETHMEDELSQLPELLEIIGISKDDEEVSSSLISFYRNNPDSLLKIMIALEFGVIEEEQRTPLCAGLTSGCLFLLGSLPSILPFAFVSHPMAGLMWAGIATGLSLLFVGGVKTWATKGNFVFSSLENLFIAGCGGALAYAVGLLFDYVLRRG